MLMAGRTNPAEGISNLIQEHEENITDRASRVSAFELRTWNVDEVAAILDQVSPRSKTRGSNDPCGPEINRSSPMIDWMFTFVQAPEVLIRHSIQQQAALCVNRFGKFQIRREAYAVMSHAWGETCGWNTPTAWGPVDLQLRKKGILHRHFLKFFDRCESEWLWVDILAMPEVFEDMTAAAKAETERLRTDVINNLRQIYMRADKVVCLDSFLLRLHSGGMIDVAVVLCLGRWITRLWTFTEARLAKQLILKTEDAAFDLDEILRFLYENVQNDEHRYFGMLTRLQPLRPVPVGHVPRVWKPGQEQVLSDIRFGGENRFCDIDIDQARALFPLLGLKWQTGWTLQQGLQRIAEIRPIAKDFVEEYCRYRGIDWSS